MNGNVLNGENTSEVEVVSLTKSSTKNFSNRNNVHTAPAMIFGNNSMGMSIYKRYHESAIFNFLDILLA